MISLKDLCLRAWDGKFTDELARKPGGFGLGQVPARTVPDKVTRAICGYCSTGCNLLIHQRSGQPVNVTADPRYPVNAGMACPKGWEAMTPLAASDRALQPLLRAGRDQPLGPISWDAAAQTFCERMKTIQTEHGPHSVAFLSTGQICMEEMALLGAFAKFGMGVRHGDGNTRQCMATSVAAYKESFGFDAPPFTYADFEESDVLVFFGANPCIAHPILWQRVLQNKRNPEIIVIDPRKTETAMAATWHVPLAPKSDLVLCYGLARILLAAGAVDASFVEQHTDGFAEFSAFLASYDLDTVAKETGLPAEELTRLAQAIRPGKRVSFWWTMGVNQGHEATRTAQAIINLALLGGHIGKPGTGANSITGQCNAMGSRLYSNTTNLLGGHDFTKPEHRAKVAAATSIPLENIPDQPSWAYDEILAGVDRGEIKGLWVIATNPVHSWIQQGRMRELLAKLDFLVVQDMYATTETAACADLVLPAAGWGEKTGCFINSERRIGLVQPAASPRGHALPDFDIFLRLLTEWGCGELFKDWQTPEAVFRILQRCSAGQPCDITGITGYGMLEELGGVQWPFPAGAEKEAATGERRLFADGRFFTASGRAKFCFAPPRAMPEPCDAAFPLILLTGRGTSSQWHTETRTGKSAILRKMQPSVLQLEVHPQDAASLSIADGGAVRVVSRRGAVEAVASLRATVGRGQVFLPMHNAMVNCLTMACFDPQSRQPSYKACAVRVERG